MRRFGLIGYPLGHSFSKPFFNTKFEKEGIDARYENFPIPSIGELPAVLAAHPSLEGLNVTIPYKEQVLPFLHALSPEVAAIGACNCIRIRASRLTGFNTDVIGFEKSFRSKWNPVQTKALVLGTGGASKAVQWVLQQMGIAFTVVSRRPDAAKGIASYETLTREEQAAASIWINTTPLGMAPDTGSFPPMDYSVLGSGHYLYDLVYNPAQTAFLARGAAQGATVQNGKDMLEIQALAGWEIWNRPE